MPRGRIAAWVAGGVLVLLPLIAQIADKPFWVTIATRIVIYALAVAALDFIVGYGGMASLGHAAYFAIGAYVVAAATTNGIDSAIVTFPLAIAVSALFAAGIGALSLRTSGVFFIMITLAFAQMIWYAILGIKSLGGDDGLTMAARDTLPGVDLANPIVFYALALALLGAFTFFAQRAIAARFGTVLRAAMQNERRALALGYDVYRYRLVAFTISGAVAGLAGALFANFERIASPDSATWAQSGDLLVMLILGGTGTLLGPILGATAFVTLQTLLVGLTEHWMAILGPVLIVVVLVGKRGLAGLIVGVRDA